MTKLQKSLAMVLLTATLSPALAQAPIQPLDLPAIQGQYNSVIQQQNYSTQFNNLQLQQNLTQDRVRELDLFRPQTPFGATSVFQPQPPGLVVPAPAPALPPPPAPKAQ